MQLKFDDWWRRFGSADAAAVVRRLSPDAPSARKGAAVEDIRRLCEGLWEDRVDPSPAVAAAETRLQPEGV